MIRIRWPITDLVKSATVFGPMHCVIVLDMDAVVAHFPTHTFAPQLGTKPHFEDKRCEKPRYLQGFGRGGGDRKQYRSEFQGLRRNGEERKGIEKEQ